MSNTEIEGPGTKEVRHAFRVCDLVPAERIATNIASGVKQIRALDGSVDDPTASLALARKLRGQIADLVSYLDGIAELEVSLETHEANHFLRLEALIRDACSVRGWHIAGEWPVFHVECGPRIEILGGQRVILVAGKRLPGCSIESIVASLQPIIAELVPKTFAVDDFAAEFAAAYDAVYGQTSQVSILDIYRGLVVAQQGPRFWRDATKEGFKGLSIDQFRARVSFLLGAGVTAALGNRHIRILPPVDPKDGVFLFQPAEQRFGFVGRVELVTVVAGSGATE